MLYLGLLLVSFPVIGVLIWIIFTFSTGSYVYILAWDSLGVTGISVIFEIIEIIRIVRSLNHENSPKRLKNFTASQALTTEALDTDTIKIFEKFKGLNLEKLDLEKTGDFDTTRTYWELQSTNNISPAENQEKIAEEQEWVNESFMNEIKKIDESSSREYIDEENEPQILDLISDEKFVDFSGAEIDYYDLECVKVKHVLSNLFILIRKEFKGGEYDEGILDEDYIVLEVNKRDVHVGLVLKNEETYQVKRNFIGAEIVDIQLRNSNS